MFRLKPQNLGLFSRKSIFVPLGKVTFRENGGMLSRVQEASREGHTHEKSTTLPDNRVPGPQPADLGKRGPDRNGSSVAASTVLLPQSSGEGASAGVPRTSGGQDVCP